MIRASLIVSVPYAKAKGAIGAVLRKVHRKCLEGALVGGLALELRPDVCKPLAAQVKLSHPTLQSSQKKGCSPRITFKASVSYLPLTAHVFHSPSQSLTRRFVQKVVIEAGLNKLVYL